MKHRLTLQAFRMLNTLGIPARSPKMLTPRNAKNTKISSATQSPVIKRLLLGLLQSKLKVQP